MPPYICIGGDYEITIRWEDKGVETVDGDIAWTIDYSRAAQGTTSGFQHRKAIFMTMDNSPKTDVVKALVKIENAESISGLVDPLPVVGETSQEAEFIYCSYTLGLGYSGSYANEAFNIKENASMGIPLLIDEITGQVKGEGTFELYTIQSVNQEGVECEVSWELVIPASVSGNVKDGKIALQVTFENTNVEDNVLNCSAAGRSFSVPAKGGPINLAPLGLGNLTFPTTGNSITSALSSPLSPAGGTGTGGVTVSLKPGTE